MEREDIIAFSWLVTFWALNYPLVKIALAYVDPYELTFLRLLLTVAALALAAPRSFRPFMGLRENLYLFLFSFLGIFCSWTLWYAGENGITPSLAVILMYTYPVIAVLLSGLILKERVTLVKVLGTLLGFAGISVIFFREPEGSLLYMLLVVLSAVTWALSIIVFRKYLAPLDYRRVNAYQMLYSLPLSAMLFPLFRTGHDLSMTFWAAMIMLSVPGTAGTFLAYVYLYSRHEVSVITPYLFLVPAISVVFSYIIFGEALSLSEVLGYALLALGIYVSSRG
ncbi:MAG: DMT family transporter [Nitrososphaeria archaeon]